MADFGVTEGLAVAGIAASAAGAGVAYLGAQSTAAAQSNADKYNAEVSANNQTMANQAAVTAQQQGAVQQQQKAYQEDVLIGQQKAGFAANGIDVGSGTAVDLMSDTKAAGELDQLSITNNAARTAQGFQNQGISYQNQAAADEASSAATLQAGALKGASSLITGAGQVSQQWYNFNTKIATTGTDNTSGF